MFEKVLRPALIALLTASVLVPAALAQDARAEDSLKLKPVTVTATKRTEAIKDVPVSLTALDSDKLAAFGQAGEDIQFLSARVPSLVIETSFGRIFPRPYIRGLGNTDFDFNASQPVCFIYDEVVYENPVLKGFPVFDTDRIEVLRGPQGTLFGRNTPAGALKFESRKPDFEHDGYLKGSYGKFRHGECRSRVGGVALSDRVALRASGVFQRRDDYIETALPPAAPMPAAMKTSPAPAGAGQRHRQSHLARQSAWPHARWRPGQLSGQRLPDRPRPARAPASTAN